MATPHDHDHLRLHDDVVVRKLLAGIESGVEHVVFSSRVTKVNRRERRQERILLLTDLALYNLNKRKALQRRVPLALIASATSSLASDEFVLHVPSSYDYRYACSAKEAVLGLIRTGRQATLGVATPIRAVPEPELRMYTRVRTASIAPSSRWHLIAGGGYAVTHVPPPPLTSGSGSSDDDYSRRSSVAGGGYNGGNELPFSSSDAPSTMARSSSVTASPRFPLAAAHPPHLWIPPPPPPLSLPSSSSSSSSSSLLSSLLNPRWMPPSIPPPPPLPPVNPPISQLQQQPSASPSPNASTRRYGSPAASGVNGSSSPSPSSSFFLGPTGLRIFNLAPRGGGASSSNGGGNAPFLPRRGSVAEAEAAARSLRQPPTPPIVQRYLEGATAGSVLSKGVGVADDAPTAAAAADAHGEPASVAVAMTELTSADVGAAALSTPPPLSITESQAPTIASPPGAISLLPPSLPSPRGGIRSGIGAALLEAVSNGGSAVIGNGSIPLAQAPPPHSSGGPAQDTGGAVVLGLEGGPSTVSLADFDLQRVLGKGSYGKVLLVRPRAGSSIATAPPRRSGGGVGAAVASSGEPPLAMKVLSKARVVARRQVEHTQAERAILESVDHPFLQRLRYAFQTPLALYLVTPFLPGGELFHHLRAAGRFPEPLARFYASEVVLGVGHLHSLDIVYRDLKPENILLDALGHVKLTDFGLSKVLSGPQDVTRTFCGTPEYLAPEVIRGDAHGQAVDWWAFGILLWELLAGSPPFSDPNPQALYTLVTSFTAPIPDGAFPHHFSQEARALLRALLHPDPHARLGGVGGEAGARAVQGHAFFKGTDWGALLARRVIPPWRPTVSGDDDTSNFESVEGGGGGGGVASFHSPSLLSLPLDASAIAAVFEGFTYQDAGSGCGTTPLPPQPLLASSLGGGSPPSVAASLG